MSRAQSEFSKVKEVVKRQIKDSNADSLSSCYITSLFFDFLKKPHSPLHLVDHGAHRCRLCSGSTMLKAKGTVEVIYPKLWAHRDIGKADTLISTPAVVCLISGLHEDPSFLKTAFLLPYNFFLSYRLEE